MGDAEIRVVRAEERDAPAAAQAPGLMREEAFASEGRWAGIVRTAPGAVSPWHHHGEHDTYFYVLAGAARVEFGPGGASVVEPTAGDFVLVPRGVVHRESNPHDAEQVVVALRVGPGGPPVVQVGGPDG